MRVPVVPLIADVLQPRVEGVIDDEPMPELLVVVELLDVVVLVPSVVVVCSLVVVVGLVVVVVLGSVVVVDSFGTVVVGTGNVVLGSSGPGSTRVTSQPAFHTASPYCVQLTPGKIEVPPEALA